ncbi:hypothetical protein SAMN04487959_104237 [Modicisalibacter xianhensis]|uniref:Uncharacterized protein n=1 Tax=Modicisalibacter xianhensis TaxID=442341 RepID=A0A1I3AA95_9GAMM|nr:hypothetical protein SAMN04487959_104237 [Halomonas xianhensis]
MCLLAKAKRDDTVQCVAIFLFMVPFVLRSSISPLPSSNEEAAHLLDHPRFFVRKLAICKKLRRIRIRCREVIAESA